MARDSCGQSIPPTLSAAASAHADVESVLVLVVGIPADCGLDNADVAEALLNELALLGLTVLGAPPVEARESLDRLPKRAGRLH